MKTKNIARSVSNYYLWLYYINNMNRYWLVCPLNLFKAYVGITMDGLIAGKKFTTIISDCRSWRQVLVTVCMPIGWLLSKSDRFNKLIIDVMKIGIFLIRYYWLGTRFVNIRI